MTERGKWDGMLAIVRFNWPFYVAATIVLLLGVMTTIAGGWLAYAGGLVILGSLYFLIGSLGVSHWVYDRSDLYRWTWLKRILAGIQMENVALCHSGFDDASATLQKKFPSTCWSVLDHYDPAMMTEASIRRARALYPPVAETLVTKYDCWSLADASQDAVFGMLAIHELRSCGERAAWFTEAKRCLADEGRIVLVEHVRDIANFFAFGPGFLHFHSVASWRQSWTTGGLKLDDSFKITPFVRVFVLKKS